MQEHFEEELIEKRDVERRKARKYKLNTRFILDDGNSEHYRKTSP